jgi:hypothetical protein
MRIGVLESSQALTDTPRFSYKRSIAEDLVRRGFAVWAIRDRIIQRVPPSGIKAARHQGSTSQDRLFTDKEQPS